MNLLEMIDEFDDSLWSRCLKSNDIVRKIHQYCDHQEDEWEAEQDNDKYIRIDPEKYQIFHKDCSVEWW